MRLVGSVAGRAGKKKRRQPKPKLSVFVPGVTPRSASAPPVRKHGTGPGLDWPDPDPVPTVRLPGEALRPATGFIAITDPQKRAYHQGLGCPACITGIDPDRGWPAPCKIQVTEFVQCRDTASVTEGGMPHHHACTFWDHYPEELPF